MIRFRHSEWLIHEESSALSKGFTLPEVCVALAVFLIGTTALLGAWGFFNREVAEERLRLERFEKVLSAMESLIAERPSCSDSTALLQISAPVLLKRIPGNKHLAWAVVERDGLALKRLVRCR
jgi:prepilin-type N-terminal cleavage/methylation domain